MMSVNMNHDRKYAKDFLAIQDLFDSINFEIINTKDINDQIIFLVKFNEPFLATQTIFSAIGFEIIGTKNIDENIIYFVRKKNA